MLFANLRHGHSSPVQAPAEKRGYRGFPAGKAVQFGSSGGGEVMHVPTGSIRRSAQRKFSPILCNSGNYNESYKLWCFAPRS